MRLEYDITTFPSETGGYNLAAYTEGCLQVSVGSTVFLDASGILLVEFAIVLHKWLQASEPCDFYYVPMDFEEEPVLAVRYEAGRDQFRLESVWSTSGADAVSRADVISSVECYLSTLRDELRREHAVDLDKTLEKAT